MQLQLSVSRTDMNQMVIEQKHSVKKGLKQRGPENIFDADQELQQHSARKILSAVYQYMQNWQVSKLCW